MNDNSKHKSSFTFTDISRYLSGGMTAAEMHELERAALQDPFLADAIEGYREADTKKTAEHLNEITSVLQKNKQLAEVIAMPKRRTYRWQIAASVIVVIGVSIFLLSRQNNTNNIASVTIYKTVAKQKTDSEVNKNTAPAAPLSQDSLLTAEAPLPSSEKRKEKAYECNNTEKKGAGRQLPSASLLSAPTTPSTDAVTPNAADSNQQYKATTKNEAPSLAPADTQKETPTTLNRLQRKAVAAPGTIWTTDKGKPFVLSEVEVINIGKKRKKTTDTSAVKPEGGWQSFQEYLFSKLNKKDTTDFSNNARFDGNLELEFSLTENGRPYNISVLHAQDSTTAKTAVDAVQQGPKWITVDKKGKRLNIRY